MEFNKFVRCMRKSPDYDKLMEEKIGNVTSKELLALCYANDLFDQKYKLSFILKLFPKEYWKLVGETLRRRIKPEKIAIAWNKIQPWLFLVDNYNKTVYDLDYLEAYYPRRPAVLSTQILK